MAKKITVSALLELINEIIRDKDRKAILHIFWDLVRITIHYRCIPVHYFSRFIYKKECNNILDYLPNSFLYNIKRKFNNPELTEITENKLFFDLFFDKLNIPVPKVLMFNHKTSFVIGNSCKQILSVDSFQEELKKLIDIQVQEPIFIKRTYGSYGGHSIYKIGSIDLMDHDLMESLYKEVISAGFLYQQTIHQHPEVDILNPSCLNTIRIDTFLDAAGNISIMSAFIRISISGSHVDNITSGGCAVEVDLETGKLKAKGYYGFRKSHSKFIYVHPITGTIFDGFALPFFPEVKKLVIQAANSVPDIRLIGWDVGITPEGPVLIEGNADYDITGGDILGGYRANQVFKKVILEATMIKKPFKK